MPKKNYTPIVMSLFLILLVCGLLAALGYFVYSSYLFYESRTYRDSIYQTLPKFAPLNEQVFAELTPPDGVEIYRTNNLTALKTTSDPLIGIHSYNVSLTATYIILDTTLDKTTAYYKDLLQTQGFEQDLQEEKQQNSHYRFHRGTTCVSLYHSIFPGVDGYLRYTLTIWYDLWAQSFSASKPPAFLMWNFESYSCPP
jgi:hypothetical protein